MIFKPDSELVIHQNTQTAIVSRADYEAVQEKLSQKKKYVRNRERPILDGKVFCYDCKCKMYLMRKNKKTESITCMSATITARRKSDLFISLHSGKNNSARIEKAALSNSTRIRKRQKNIFKKTTIFASGKMQL